MNPTAPIGRGLPRLPNLVLAGVTKAGTTSLVSYLRQHPEICTGPTKGTHFFTPLRYGPAELPPIAEYARAFAGCRTRYVLDGSISYCTGGEELVAAVRAALPDARVVMSLRDPVDRLWSSYKMKRTRGVLPEGMRFGPYVAACERLCDAGRDRLAEDERFRSLATGRYGDYLPMWWEAFGDAFRVVFFDDLVVDPAAVVRELCAWLGLDTAPVDAFEFAPSNRTVQHRSPALRSLVDRARARAWGRLEAHPRLVARLRGAYRAVNTTAFSEELPGDLRRHVHELYRSSNETTARELTARGYRNLPGWLASVREVTA